MTIVDWRGVPNAPVAAALGRDRQRWLAELRWDPAIAHAHIETARTTWGLPGLAAVDAAGNVLGLVYYFDTGERFEIGGVIAPTPLVTKALVSGVVRDAAALGRDLFCFALDAPGLAMELARHGCGVEPFVYLGRDLSGAPSVPPQPAPASRAWTVGDSAATADLLQRAYLPEDSLYFAPGNTVAGWQQYVDGIVGHEACGAVLPGVSRCVTAGGQLAAVSLVAKISPDTVHLVQLAVDPAHRGRRLSVSLLEASCTEARALGFTAIMLMASSRNQAACRLYAQAGFTRRAMFVAATRPAQSIPTRAAS
jgi:ribosomal protein S18 acetylase RimI-like enzyme